LKACPARTTGGCDDHASCGNHHGASLLEISVAAGEAGPVLTLSGEADLTTVAELTEALTAQVARALSLLGVDQAIEVRDGMSAGADPDR
jgi:hypothetical protein